MIHYKILLLIYLLFSTTSIFANDSIVYKYKTLSLSTANKAAQETLIKCRALGYSVAVAIVDRGGNLQVFLRDQFAGPHTIQTAIQKAWTANSFRQSTDQLAQLLQQKKIPQQVQHNPGALLVGGGRLIQAQGQTLGGIGVSGAPPGKSEAQSIDSRCAIAGLKAIADDLEFSD